MAGYIDQFFREMSECMHCFTMNILVTVFSVQSWTSCNEILLSNQWIISFPYCPQMLLAGKSCWVIVYRKTDDLCTLDAFIFILKCIGEV